MLINSWKGFFSIGSSFLGLLTGLTGVSISFFRLALESEFLWGLLLFETVLVSPSDLGSLISSEFDLVMLSDFSLLTLLFMSKFSS